MTKAADILRLLHAHPLPARPRPPPVRNHWHAFLALWRHGGEPPSHDERGLRWSAAAVTLGMHLGFALLLLWFALVGLPPPPAEEGEGARIRIEFVGKGTPEETEPREAEEAWPDPIPEPELAPRPVSAAAESPAASPPRPTPEIEIPSPELAAALPQPVQREVPEPAPAAAQQPLQVTETRQPTRDFVLPPTTPRLAEAVPRNIEAPVLEVPSRDIVVPVRPAAPTLPEPAIETPSLVHEAPLRTREVPAPLRPVETARIPVETPAAAELVARVPEFAEREVPAPAGTPAQAPAEAAAAPVVPDPGTAAAAQRPDTVAATPSASDTPGTPAPAASPLRNDDWGISDRDAPGDARDPGLFNEDGSVRLPPGAVAGGPPAQRGAPGGADDGWSRERFEQAGTWLQRPPYDYTPTRFDQFWVPSESLLAEWVRRNVRELEIPIPGTSLRLSCVISVLQFGGGCGLVDPNRQDRPAGARPPPDIPFKPELQEDNGALPPNIEPERPARP